MKQIYSLLLLTLISVNIHSELNRLKGTDSIGYFSNKRTPSNLFSFGQNIITKNTSIVYAYLSQIQGKQQNDTELLLQYIYGVSSRASLLINVPIIFKVTLGDLLAHGIGDITFQGEFAWYTKNTRSLQNQATLVANISVPTAHVSPDGQLAKIQPIGFGAVTFFIGATASYTSEKWYAFLSDGVTITLTGKNKHKVGNSLLYQGGFGHFLGTPWGVTCAGVFEIDGTWSAKNKTCSGTNENSGGNTIFVGPSLLFYGNEWAFMGGIQGPVLQQLNGTQNKQYYAALFSLSYQFQ